jgi:DNA-binding MarR family transcriptional regulator
MDENARGKKGDDLSYHLAVADRLHSAAIHLLRHVRRQDPASGLSAPRLSALSVIVFGGPVTISDLAQAEQVQLPTISRLITSLEHEGLVQREVDPTDRRVVRVRATPVGKRVLDEGRERRIRDLGEQLLKLPAGELDTLHHAADILERLSSDEGRPHE